MKLGNDISEPNNKFGYLWITHGFIKNVLWFLWDLILRDSSL